MGQLNPVEVEDSYFMSEGGSASTAREMAR